MDIKLDESQFCKHCSPDVKEPVLGLVVTFEGSDQPHCVWNVTHEDVKLVHEFLSGSKTHKDLQDNETPLKNHIKRLKELLGIEIEKE